MATPEGDVRPGPTPAAEPVRAAGGAWLRRGLPVLVLSLFAAALYLPAMACGLVSDSWHLLFIGSQPLREAITTRLGYHSIPVAHLLNAVLWRCLGLRDLAYQAVNLGELLLVAAGLYWVGRKLFRAEIAFIAALFFLANASFYEVPLWTGVGNFQSLAALLYLASLLVALEAGHSTHPIAWSILLGVLGLAAFFTYEPAVSVLPVAALAATFAGARAEGSRRERRWRFAAAPTVAVAIAAAVILAVKTWLVATGDHAMFLPASLDEIRQRLYWVERAVLGIFSLRASDPVVAHLHSLGTEPSYGEPWFNALVAGWLLAMAAVASWLVSRGPTVVRLVTAWFAIHLGLLSVATAPQSRHLLLAALPAALLTSWVLWTGAERVFGQGRRRPLSPALVSLTALLLLMPGAKRDLDAATRLYASATAASRQIRELIDLRCREQPPLTAVTLVNLPASVFEGGVAAYFFQNGAQFMVELGSQGRISHRDVRLVTTHGPGVTSAFANGTRPISLPDLEAQVGDPTTLVLAFDRRSRAVARLSPTDWQLPSSYTPATAPYLPWEAGGWLELAPGGSLELVLPRDHGREWVALRFLRTSAAAPWLESGGRRLAVPTKQVSANYWSTALFPLGEGPERFSGAVGASTETLLSGVWSFLPPRAYSPRTAPFLSWWSWGDVFLNLQESVDLPLDVEGCGRGCQVRIEYLDEPDRRFTISSGAGPPRRLGDTGGAGRWATRLLPLPEDAAIAVLRVEPAGEKPVCLRTIERVAPGDADIELGARRASTVDAGKPLE